MPREIHFDISQTPHTNIYLYKYLHVHVIHYTSHTLHQIFNQEIGVLPFAAGVDTVRDTLHDTGKYDTPARSVSVWQPELHTRTRAQKCCKDLVFIVSGSFGCTLVSILLHKSRVKQSHSVINVR